MMSQFDIIKPEKWGPSKTYRFGELGSDTNCPPVVESSAFGSQLVSDPNSLILTRILNPPRDTIHGIEQGRQHGVILPVCRTPVFEQLDLQ
jgi:hypothetical protein